MASSNLDVRICWDETCGFSVPTGGTSETIQTFLALNHLSSCHQSLSLPDLMHRYGKWKWKETSICPIIPCPFVVRPLLGSLYEQHVISITVRHPLIHWKGSEDINAPWRNCKGYTKYKPVPVVAWSKAWICGRSMLRLRVWIPPNVWMSVCCECCVLSDRGPYVKPITRPEESCRVWCVWVW